MKSLFVLDHLFSKVKESITRNQFNLKSNNCCRGKITIVLVLFALLTISFPVTPQEIKQENRTIVSTGEIAPDISLNDFQGKQFTLSNLKNRKAVVLWFTNLCSGCQSKLPHVEKLKNEFLNKDIEVVAVSQLGEDRKTVEDAVRKENLTFRFLYDPTGEVTEKFTGKYIPDTCPLKNIYLIDKSGKIIYSTHYPGVSEEELSNQVNKLMKGKQQ